MQHRTGRLVGCFRKLQNWCLFSVIDEYQRFSGVKSHATDVIFTETFDATCLRQSFNSTIFLHQIYGTGKRQSLYRDFSLQLGQLPSASSSENLQHTNVNHQFYGTSCQNESATAGTQAPFSLLRSGSVPVGAYALQRENEFLERPGQLECQFYMKTGDYKSGAVCWFHHTRERVLPAPDCVLSPIGLPLCPQSSRRNYTLVKGIFHSHSPLARSIKLCTCDFYPKGCYQFQAGLLIVSLSSTGDSSSHKNGHCSLERGI
ncbi:hypothetical protein V6N12_015386 [Hibiscus sabdariffa]|uniref:C3H1-type domain-containing protein n=1 Tax=Hibiscus sabdariffa TaxID=183260 RepID=A0ABR2DN12_9ROSI